MRTNHRFLKQGSPSPCAYSSTWKASAVSARHLQRSTEFFCLSVLRHKRLDFATRLRRFGQRVTLCRRRVIFDVSGSHGKACRVRSWLSRTRARALHFGIVCEKCETRTEVVYVSVVPDVRAHIAQFEQIDRYVQQWICLIRLSRA